MAKVRTVLRQCRVRGLRRGKRREERVIARKSGRGRDVGVRRGRSAIARGGRGKGLRRSSWRRRGRSCGGRARVGGGIALIVGGEERVRHWHRRCCRRTGRITRVRGGWGRLRVVSRRRSCLIRRIGRLRRISLHGSGLHRLKRLCRIRLAQHGAMGWGAPHRRLRVTHSAHHKRHLRLHLGAHLRGIVTGGGQSGAHH